MLRRLGLLFFSLSLVSEGTALHLAQKALCRRSALIAALAAHEPATRFFDCCVSPGIRSPSYGLNLLTRRVWALDTPSADRDLEQYSAGVRASGRGANALLKKRSETGVRRTGSVGSALFAPGQVLDELFCEDNSIVSVVFAFPEAWSLAKGPNLDVRDVRTSDSAFVLAASLPQDAKIDNLATASSPTCFSPRTESTAATAASTISKSQTTRPRSSRRRRARSSRIAGWLSSTLFSPTTRTQCNVVPTFQPPQQAARCSCSSPAALPTVSSRRSLTSSRFSRASESSRLQRPRAGTHELLHPDFVRSTTISRLDRTLSPF
mmetsp:Transcript_55430/g.120768  ORF Transcript_55430/g.120768 Transcript_55430/m.120768 type:complete len:321 (-) Transcript_55430:458-1420(-)